MWLFKNQRQDTEGRIPSAKTTAINERLEKGSDNKIVFAIRFVDVSIYTELIEIVQPYRMWTFGDFDQRMPIPMHSYLTILRKPENECLCNYY